MLSCAEDSSPHVSAPQVTRVGEVHPMCRWHAEIAIGTTAAIGRRMTIAITQSGSSPGLALEDGLVPGRSASRPRRPDSWVDALAKLIPGEVIVAFTAALQVSGVGNGIVSHVAILVVFASLCPLVLWISAMRAAMKAPWLQYVVRTLAFALYGLGSDPVLMVRLDKLQRIPPVGALVVAVLAALVLSPPGAQKPPSRGVHT
jgi:hypothetical protein